MQIVNFFAMVGMGINDIIVIYSVIGSLMLLLGAFLKPYRKKFDQFADWSILGFVFVAIGQIAMAVTATTPKKIGFIIGVSPWLVNVLLLLSLLLLAANWWIRKNKK